MRLLLILLSTLSLSATSHAQDFKLRLGGGLGFSNWDKSQEKHDSSNMIFGVLVYTQKKNNGIYL